MLGIVLSVAVCSFLEQSLQAQLSPVGQKERELFIGDLLSYLQGLQKTAQENRFIKFTDHRLKRSVELEQRLEAYLSTRPDLSTTDVDHLRRFFQKWSAVVERWIAFHDLYIISRETEKEALPRRFIRKILRKTLPMDESTEFYLTENQNMAQYLVETTKFFIEALRLEFFNFELLQPGHAYIPYGDDNKEYTFWNKPRAQSPDATPPFEERFWLGSRQPTEPETEFDLGLPTQSELLDADFPLQTPPSLDPAFLNTLTESVTHEMVTVFPSQEDARRAGIPRISQFLEDQLRRELDGQDCTILTSQDLEIPIPDVFDLLTRSQWREPALRIFVRRITNSALRP